MFRNKKTEDEKKLIRAFREYNKMWKENRGQWVDVEPYQRGWVRTFTLRYDIKNRNDAHVIRQCLDLINSEQFSRREDFKEYSYRTKQYEEKKLQLKTITKKKYDELPDRIKKYFVEYKHIHHPYKGRIWEEDRARFKLPYFFVYEVSPHMIVREWVPDAEWEARRQELSDYLWKNRDRSGKLSRMQGWNRDRWDMRDKYLQFKRGHWDHRFTEEDYEGIPRK